MMRIIRLRLIRVAGVEMLRRNITASNTMNMKIFLNTPNIDVNISFIAFIEAAPLRAGLLHCFLFDPDIPIDRIAYPCYQRPDESANEQEHGEYIIYQAVPAALIFRCDA